ncbi:protein of unknown function [Taphrina deformans PYCC 5710]|uniref:Zinc finger PHD-type domain-containing protein n=1 Tax=Taphrina deformans (strain PYCC 5710 / ATCC 11124 / CBS 356.35 / IMI 108563 / JCM 9778 / NBRC 8474) TaxID=1097556 RepID=R4XD69_TAPDE|nr:protein of unknown function [Taphrina deformans PYCC 5710]|eukprot:CCG83826.1 protein of unknown function [Taphrina deformans PYCC 5710]
MSGAESAGEEIEEVTRCVCGNIDLRIEEDYEDTGLFVQCDKCLVWQHGYCVGLVSDNQMPETYFCELCRPDLHRLIQRPRKLPRSKFLGIDNASSPPPLRVSEEPNDQDAESGPRKRRSTMNSRDAAYDRQLEAALLLSAQQDGGSMEMPAPSISARSGRGTRRQSPSTSKRGRTPSPSPQREDPKQKRRRKGGSVKKEEPAQEDSAGSRRRGKKKTGIASNGSASSSLATPDMNEDQADTDNTSQASRARPNTADKSAPAQLAQADSRPGSRAASRETTPAPTGTTRKRAGARTGKNKTGNASLSRSNTTTTTTAAPSTPSGRMTAMSEMRKRVSSILEYVGRAQEEMATEVTEWSQFVPRAELALEQEGEGREGTGKKSTREDGVWGYGYGEGGSVALMEELTSNLLRWESIYG